VSQLKFLGKPKHPIQNWVAACACLVRRAGSLGRLLSGTLLLVLTIFSLGLSVCAQPAAAQSSKTVESVGQLSGKVVDARGEPVEGAQILDNAGKVLATSAADGSFTMPAETGTVNVVAPHFAPSTFPLEGTSPVRIILNRPLENVVVTAYRSPLASADSPASTVTLTQQTLQQGASAGLDGKLRQVPGFELFRRSSSLVANPTTEGVSLRGLGSTAASRSLVLFDDIPLNDPYGGWIHWEEFPPPVIHSVELVRGGASDLYGSSAIGGVIAITPVRPESTRLELTSSYGSLSTTEDSMLGMLNKDKWAGLATASLIGTDGYTLIAPNLRGPIDQPSNVHAHSGLVQVGRQTGANGDVFLRGSVLDESRHNGTPLQINGTRLWRFAAGTDLSHLTVRLFGTSEHYDQTFSNIATNRKSETLTRFGQNPATELGAAALWQQTLGSRLLVLAGADTRDIRAADYETMFTGGGGMLNTSARQRQTGVYGEVLYTPRDWTISASARIDHFSNFDPVQVNKHVVVPLPSFSQTPFDPRVGVSRRLTRWLALNGSAFRAFRAPTQNELYRTGQVGQQITLPNPNLRSERATGWETGFQSDLSRLGSSLRISYFWTRIDRPVTALTLSSTPTSSLLQRENLGQIESRGISLDYAVLAASWVSIQGGYQYANATVTSYAQEPYLVGKWIPQVARNMATTQVNLNRRRLGILSVQGRISGHQFDDDLNQYLLHSYFRLDVYASHDFGSHLQAFAAGENLFDRSIEVGKTPLTTLGTPRVARFGLRVNFGD
jgi:outer membrane receptor protein involved in Fe transport